MKSRNILILVGIILIGAGLRWRLASDKCLHDWDERFHALVAKNLIKHPLKPTLYEDPVLNYDYKQWNSNHVWLHKQPIPLWLIASSYKIFGVSELVTRIPSLIFSILAIFLTFLLGKKLFSERIGILAAFFMSVNGLVLEIGSGRVATDHYDLLFMVFILISIIFAYYNSVKRIVIFSIFSGFFMSLALLTKWLPCLIILPVHFFLLANFRAKPTEIIKQLSYSLLTCVIFALPWQIYTLSQYPMEAKWEYFTYVLHLTTELDGHTGNGYLYFINIIRINYSEIVYLPLMFYGYRLYKSKEKNFILNALFVWIFVPIIFFSFSKTKMQGYILFICPALFILTAAFFFEVKEWALSKRLKGGARIASPLLLAAMLILPIRYCLERSKFGIVEPDAGSYKTAYQDVIGVIPNKGIILNVKHPVEFMFYNGGSAYSTSELSDLEKNRLHNSGYTTLKLSEDNRTLELIK